MKHFKYIIFLCGITGIIAWGCEKNKQDTLNSTGLILDYGDPAVDGCGWMIEINKLVYSPKSLDSSFRKDGLKVIIDYQQLSTIWNCGWRSPGYKQIEIKNIKKL